MSDPWGGASPFTVWLLGVSLGLTACAVTCLPFIGTWALGRADTRGGRLRDTALFLGGRLLAYTLLGGLAGALGGWLVSTLASGIGNAAIGASGLLAAFWLALPQRHGAGCTSRQWLGRRGAPLSPLLLGMALTLIPCAPLGTLLSACAASGNLWRGAGYGALFGSGALLTPMLVLIPAAGSLGRALGRGRPWLRHWLHLLAALVLLALGGQRLALAGLPLWPALLCWGMGVLAVHAASGTWRRLVLLPGARKRGVAGHTILLRQEASQAS